MVNIHEIKHFEIGEGREVIMTFGADWSAPKKYALRQVVENNLHLLPDDKTYFTYKEMSDLISLWGDDHDGAVALINAHHDILQLSR